MPIHTAIFAELRDDYTAFILVGLLVTLLVSRSVQVEKRRVYGLAVLTGLHTIMVPVAAILRATGSTHYLGARLPCLAFGALAAVGMIGFVLFNAALPRLHLSVPKILQDVLVGVASVVALFVVASRVGIDVSGLVATSAVLTAVIGLALQDTLGNIVAGLALQTDDSIRVGDWIEVGGKIGKVTEIRWRYTAMETRDWETVILPNNQLVKNQVSILGRRTGEVVKLRCWVYFHVDFRYSPSLVREVIEKALQGSPLRSVARTPAPDCVLVDTKESYARYGIRYWLEDLSLDVGVDADVLTRAYNALRRAQIPLSMPAHALFMTEDTPERRHEKAKREVEHRLQALENVDLLSPLSQKERSQLAEALRFTPFGRGEILAKQDDRGNCMYLLTAGRVAVLVSTDDGHEREVARLEAGSFFGEMSLLTGERRTATITALDEVECYRLDKSAFEQVLVARPKVAEYLAEVLARRKTELTAAREDMDHEARSAHMAASKSDLLGRIRGFFGLGEQQPASTTKPLTPL